MPIPLQCPGCGKKYQVADRLAGKHARCKCGAAMSIPGGAAETGSPEPGGLVQSEEDWVAAAFDLRADAPAELAASPVTSSASPSRPIAAPPVIAAPAVARPAPAPPPAAEEPPPDAPDRPKRKKKKPWWKKAKIQRQAAGISAIGYGALMTLVVLLFLVLNPPDGVFDLSERLVKLVLAVLIALGGILILKRHKHGPACAGLTCLFLCFFPAWRLVLEALSALTVGQLLPFLVVMVVTVVLYGIPVAITVWSLREETARQEREAQEEPYR